MDKDLLKVPHFNIESEKEIAERFLDIDVGNSIIKKLNKKIYDERKQEEERFYMDLINKDKYWFYRGVIYETNTGLSFVKQYANQEPTLEEMIQGELGMSILRMGGYI